MMRPAGKGRAGRHPAPRSAPALPARPWCPFLAALGLRAGAVLALGHYLDPVLWENGELAGSLLRGEGYRLDFAGPNTLSSWQAPGYPTLLAGTWLLLGRTPAAHLALSLLQALALAGAVLPVGRIAGRWFGPRAAAWARWLACLLPLHVWYATRLHQTGLVLAAHPWLLAAALDLLDRPGRRRGLAFGAALGLAGLFQPILLGVFPGLLALLWLARPGRAAALPALAAAGLAAAAVLAPWTARNWLVHGVLVPVKDSFGKELWLGNNPHATGTGYTEGGETEITFAHPPQAFALRGRAGEAALMAAMGREARDFILADPGAFIRRTVTKVWWFWTAAPRRLVRSGAGGEALRFRGLHLASWAVLAGLAALGAASERGGRRGEWGRVLLVYAALYSAIYGLTHVGQARYRGEIEYLLVPLAAAGLAAAALRAGRIWRGSPGLGMMAPRSRAENRRRDHEAHPARPGGAEALPAEDHPPGHRAAHLAADPGGGVHPGPAPRPHPGRHGLGG